MDVGLRLAKFRKAKGLSKNKLAKDAGVTQGFISQIESGIRLPTLEVLNRICTALGITLSEFFAEDGQPEELPPDVRRICEKVKHLPPDKRKVLESVLDTWVDD